MNNNFVLLFPHIPKTGGTSLLYHFRQNIGDNKVLIYGPHNRIIRFFANEYQYEELPKEKWQNLRVIQGHHVNENIYKYPFKIESKIIIVLRHPYAHANSQFNHRKNHLNRIGIDIDEEKYLQKRGNNFLVRTILKAFPSFIDDDSNNDFDKAISILKKIDYIFTTEHLNAQSQFLMQDLGLPKMTEKRRVAVNKISLKANEQDILKNNQLDLELFNIANQSYKQEYKNPFGFEKLSQQNSIRKIRKKSESYSEDLIKNMYEHLASHLCKQLLAEKALYKLETEDEKIAIKNIGLYKEILLEKWSEFERKLNNKQIKMSKENLERFKRKNKG